MKDNRINIIRKEEELEITIKAFCDEKKQNMLTIWIVLFTLCGIIIISQFFGDYDSGTKVFFAVYVAFWLFFEFKVIYAYRWRKYGEEKLMVKDGKLTLVKSIKNRGVTQILGVDEIEKIDFYKDENGKFVKSMNTSYWNINRYTLSVYTNNGFFPFAIDVDNTQAKKILHEIRSNIK